MIASIFSKGGQLPAFQLTVCTLRFFELRKNFKSLRSVLHYYTSTAKGLDVLHIVRAWGKVQ